MSDDEARGRRAFFASAGGDGFARNTKCWGMVSAAAGGEWLRRWATVSGVARGMLCGDASGTCCGCAAWVARCFQSRTDGSWYHARALQVESSEDDEEGGGVAERAVEDEDDESVREW